MNHTKNFVEPKFPPLTPESIHQFPEEQSDGLLATTHLNPGLPKQRSLIPANQSKNHSINFKPYEDEYTFNRGVIPPSQTSEQVPLIEVILSNGNRVLLTNNEYLAYNLALGENKKRNSIKKDNAAVSPHPERTDPSKEPKTKPKLVDKSIQMSVRDFPPKMYNRATSNDLSRRGRESVVSMARQNPDTIGKVSTERSISANPQVLPKLPAISNPPANTEKPQNKHKVEDPKLTPISRPTINKEHMLPAPIPSQRIIKRPDLIKKLRKVMWGVASLPMYKAHISNILSHRYAYSQDFFLHDMEKILRSFVEDVKRAVSSNVDRVLEWKRSMDFAEIRDEEDQADRDERYDILVDVVIDIVEDLVELSKEPDFNKEMVLLLSKFY